MIDELGMGRGIWLGLTFCDIDTSDPARDKCPIAEGTEGRVWPGARGGMLNILGGV